MPTTTTTTVKPTVNIADAERKKKNKDQDKFELPNLTNQDIFGTGGQPDGSPSSGNISFKTFANACSKF